MSVGLACESKNGFLRIRRCFFPPPRRITLHKAERIYRDPAFFTERSSEVNILKSVTDGAEAVGSVYKSCEKRCPYELTAKGSWHWGIRRGSSEVAGMSIHGDFALPVVRILAAVICFAVTVAAGSVFGRMLFHLKYKKRMK